MQFLCDARTRYQCVLHLDDKMPMTSAPFLFHAAHAFCVSRVWDCAVRSQPDFFSCYNVWWHAVNR